MPRIATMIASATEIVCALGLESDLVARSHECDWPPSVKKLPVCTAPRFDVHGSSGEIDQRVKSLLSEMSSIYRVDGDLLGKVRPEVIITQSQCEVCAVSDKDVREALRPSPRWGEGGQLPRIVSMSPNNLAEVWHSIRNVADALGVSTKGEMLVQQLKDRIQGIIGRVPKARPTVACLEWLDPLMAAGNWVPELVELAGGRNLFGEAGKHSPWMSWEQARASDPDIVIAMPCGFDLLKTSAEMRTLHGLPGWTQLKAVRNQRVYATDGNQFFNRPGPRLVESLEILAEILHPGRFCFEHEAKGWQSYV